jgi:carboxyl-terminal processing protease
MTEPSPELISGDQPRPRRPPLSPLHRGIRLLAVGCLLLLLGAAAGIVAERDYFNPAGEHPLSELNTIHGLVDDNYYYRPTAGTPEAAFQRDLEYNAIGGMMSSLDDYSRFLPPKQATEASDQLAGEYSGIGINASFSKSGITVISPMLGQPADKAGVRPGDVIVAVDGQNLTKMSEDQALDLVKGPAGSKVKLTIDRKGHNEPLQLDVTRAKIDVPVVNYEYFAATRTAWIQITIFGNKTTAQLDEALVKASADGATGLVLDLRHNGGGWVTSAQEVIGRFLPARTGPAFWEDESPGPGGAASLPIINGKTEAFDTPLVVLVDGGTASASEIVTGALKDYSRATIVGEKTFGKGSVQKVFDLTDGSSARITFAEWFTAKEHRIQGIGIEPDKAVEAGKGTGPSGDAQIDAGIAILQHGSSAAPSATPLATPAATPAAISRESGSDALVIGVVPELLPRWA